MKQSWQRSDLDRKKLCWYIGCGGMNGKWPMQEIEEIQVQSLGWEDPLEEEMATHSSILA